MSYPGLSVQGVCARSLWVWDGSAETGFGMDSGVGAGFVQGEFRVCFGRRVRA